MMLLIPDTIEKKAILKGAKMQVPQIKAYLKENKITYPELSEKSGIPLGTLKSIFSGRTPAPRIDTIQAIERALGLTTAFTEEDYTNGITDKARIEVNAEDYEWLELKNEIINAKGKEYYKTLNDIIKAAIKQK